MRYYWMQAFQKHEGLAVVLNRSNIDTDQIIPKQFLKKIERSGFGKHLFHDWRFLDTAGLRPNPDFELNAKRYAGASVLIAGENFGCGSSREHAPWALGDYGFRVIVAPSFADIFYNNCLKNGLLLAVLPVHSVRAIVDWVSNQEGAKVSVDLNHQELSADGQKYHFEIDPFAKENLLHGRDEIDLSLQCINEIQKFEARHFEKGPPFLRVSLSE